VDDFASVRHTGDTVTVALHRDLDYAVVTELSDVLASARGAPGVRRVVVDLVDVRFIDSSGLGALVAAFRFARQDGLSLFVVNPRPRVLALLTITGVTRILAPEDASG